MTGQLSLLDGAARRSDPDTSKSAARAQRGGVAPRIVEVVKHYGPLCDDEICECLPEFHAPTVKSARSRLTKAGVLGATGETRESWCGHAQQVWDLRVETVRSEYL